MREYVFQESVHSTWLNNGLAEFQSRLTDALTGASAGGANAADAHSPLTRATAAAGAAATSGGGGSSKQARPPPVI